VGGFAARRAKTFRPQTLDFRPFDFPTYFTGLPFDLAFGVSDKHQFAVFVLGMKNHPFDSMPLMDVASQVDFLRDILSRKLLRGEVLAMPELLTDINPGIKPSA
jgi:hypothetical protein